ncbi:MAG: OB-fold nucleic acid binding domain-containing protein, partial [Bacillota bacterium]|nr:OB-fold nucleic acid binding domain-containing protein [Bacillota bacterium]
MKLTRSMAGELGANQVGREVRLCGWVAKRRDLGGLIFADIRDITGIVQIVFSPDSEALFREAETLRSEFVVEVSGMVQARPADGINRHMKTGEIEIYGRSLSILNAAKTTPFYIQPDVNADESLRLKYRYLDLRRPELQAALILRHKVSAAVRNYLDSHDFLEIETPQLTR